MAPNQEDQFSAGLFCLGAAPLCRCYTTSIRHKLNQNSQLSYIVLLAGAALVLRIVWTGYRTSLLTLWISTAAAFSLALYVVVGLARKQPIEKRSTLWRWIGVAPLILGTAFIGAWILLIVLFAIFWPS